MQVSYKVSELGLVGLTSTATIVALGTSSYSSSNRFSAMTTDNRSLAATRPQLIAHTMGEACAAVMATGLQPMS